MWMLPKINLSSGPIITDDDVVRGQMVEQRTAKRCATQVVHVGYQTATQERGELQGGDTITRVVRETKCRPTYWK